MFYIQLTIVAWNVPWNSAQAAFCLRICGITPQDVPRPFRIEYPEVLKLRNSLLNFKVSPFRKRTKYAVKEVCLLL